MSMRQRVGRQEIERFHIEVGRTHQPGRLYLTGGAALVHRGIRPGQTLDIAIQVTIDPANPTNLVALEHEQWIGRMHMEEPSSSTPQRSKKQQEKRARAEAKQQKRQERARKKRLQRGQERAHMHEALHKIGATLEKGGKHKGAS